MRILLIALSALLLAVSPTLAQVKVPKSWTIDSARTFLVNKTSIVEFAGKRVAVFLKSPERAYIQIEGSKEVAVTHWTVAISALERPFALCLVFDKSEPDPRTHSWMGDLRCMAVPRLAQKIVEQQKGDALGLAAGNAVPLADSAKISKLLAKDGFPYMTYYAK